MCQTLKQPMKDRFTDTKWRELIASNPLGSPQSISSSVKKPASRQRRMSGSGDYRPATTEAIIPLTLA